MTASLALLLVVTVLAAPAGAQAPAERPGAVCPHPARRCAGFADGDLTFELAGSAGIAAAERRSEWFWAVVLRSGPRCSIGEAARRRAQARFPDRQVFVHHFDCDGDVERNVTYDGVRRDVAFLAVYGGRTREEADAFRRRDPAVAAWTGAYLRRMRVVRVGS